MSDFTVRSAVPGDQGAIEEVSAAATATLRQTYRPTRAALEARAAVAERLERLVACVDGHVVGVVEYRVEGERLHFMGLGVHPACRRRGAGRALVEVLCRIARERGLASVSLYTVRETGNERIFKSMGFRTVASEPSKLFESDRFETLTEVRMERALSDRD